MATTMVAERTGGGTKWTKYMVTKFLQGQFNSGGEMAAGVAMLGDGVWLPPQGLAALKPGQVLDEDPLTETRLVVEQALPGPLGQALVISRTGRGFKRLLGYDLAKGLLVYMNEATQIGTAIHQTEVQYAGGM